MGFVLHTLAVALLFAAWGIAAGMMMRRLRLLCLAIGAIAGSGAYAFALVTASGPPALGWTAAAAVGGAAGIAAVGLAGRVRGHDYVLGTFALMLAWESFVAAAVDVTGGPFGIPGVAALPLSQAAGAPVAFVLGAGGLLIFAAVLVWWEASRRMRVAAGILARSRELADSFAVPSVVVLAAYGAGIGVICGLGGGLLTAYLGYMGPGVVTLSTTIVIAALALGYDRGIAVFVALLLLLTILPELLRLIAIGSAESIGVRTVLAGAALIILELVRTAPGRAPARPNR